MVGGRGRDLATAACLAHSSAEIGVGGRGRDLATAALLAHSSARPRSGPRLRVAHTASVRSTLPHHGVASYHVSA
eukprot:2945914-Rhodomonas_salina.2